jgi:molybdopterin-guanine dinucleotide biosynthesis protein A
MPARTDDVGVVVLAGGRATRFPGKLEALVDGTPLLARVVSALREVGPIAISARDTFSPRLDALLDCPIVVDRWPDRGPLGGLLSACGELSTPRVFAVAGDAPLVTREVVETLCAAWEPGDEAAVPAHDGGIEPLAALYERSAVLREAWNVLQTEGGAMHALLARLRTRRVPLDARYFLNINTPSDLAADGRERA